MKKLFRKEASSRKRLNGTIILASQPTFKVFAFLMLTLIVITSIFLVNTSYTKKETVNGILLPNKGLIKLYSERSGTIKAMHVKEGQNVKVGQPILTIISQQFGSDGLEVNDAVMQQYKKQISSIDEQIETEHKTHQLVLKNLKHQAIEYTNRLPKLRLRQSVIQQRIDLNTKTIENLQALIDNGYASELRIIEQKDNQLSLKQLLVTAESEIDTTLQKLASVDILIKQAPLDFARTIGTLNRNRSDLEIALSRLTQNTTSEIRSPVDGIVTLTLIKKGQAVVKHQNLIGIAPSKSKLQAVLYVPTSAFGFIEVGQDVKIRYTAFPFQRYGNYLGQVARVSKEVMLPSDAGISGLVQSPSYRVVVSLDSQEISAYGKNLALRSGMLLNADIVTEERSLIRWLFDPIYSIKGRLE